MILQTVASLQPGVKFYTILYCNNYCKIVVSCKLSVYIAFYLTLKYRTDGPMVVINKRNMQLYRNI